MKKENHVTIYPFPQLFKQEMGATHIVIEDPQKEKGGGAQKRERKKEKCSIQEKLIQTTCFIKTTGNQANREPDFF